MRRVPHRELARIEAIDIESPRPVLLSQANSAQRQAQLNLNSNVRALQKTQPQLIASEMKFSKVDWLYARDGSLTALDENQKWWAACSVPARAAEELLRTLEISSP